MHLTKPYDIAQGDLGDNDVKLREKKFRGIYFLKKSSSSQKILFFILQKIYMFI